MRDKDEYISWDFSLLTALQVIEDHTDQNGILVWEKESDRVEIIADRKIDKFQASVQAKTDGKNYKPARGEYFVPNVSLRGGEWPTYGEYLGQFIEDGTMEE